MTSGKSIAAGWYKDPAAPETQRYWDGEQWLGEPIPLDVDPPSTPPQPPAPVPVPDPDGRSSWDTTPSGHAEPGSRPLDGGSRPPGGAGRPGQPPPPGGPWPQAGPGRRPTLTMPTGFTGASLERRLGARAVDIALVGLLSLVANSWLGYRYLQILVPYLRDALRNPGTPPAPPDSQLNELLYPMLLISLVLWFVYEVVSTSRTGQTVGKRLLRIKVVRMDGSDLDFGSAFRRWSVLSIPNLLFPCGIPIQLMDVLWCTWDRPLAQCIHDKWALTVVVSAKPADLPVTPTAPSERKDTP